MTMQMPLTAGDALRRGPARARATGGPRLLVAVSLRAARVYAYELRNSVPQPLIPYDRTGFGRHLHWAAHQDGTGRHTRAQDRFAGSVAHTLCGAGELLLLGNGPGARAAASQLFAVLRRRYQDLADRVVGSIVVAEDHLTEDQLLAATCAFYAGGGGALDRPVLL